LTISYASKASLYAQRPWREFFEVEQTGVSLKELPVFNHCWDHLNIISLWHRTRIFYQKPILLRLVDCAEQRSLSRHYFANLMACSERFCRCYSVLRGRGHELLSIRYSRIELNMSYLLLDALNWSLIGNLTKIFPTIQDFEVQASAYQSRRTGISKTCMIVASCSYWRSGRITQH
jgi:hypothetical protein